MRVKLRVLKGKNAGKEVKLPTPKCIIGRGDDCHLRPKSDAVSRRHCALLTKESRITIRDLKSKNGTFVDGEAIVGDLELKGGEHVKVGPLEFEIMIDHSLGGDKKPVVKDVKDAARRTADSTFDDTDIGSWLDEADQDMRSRTLSDPDTRQFKLDETDRVKLEQAAEEQAAAEAEEEEAKKKEAEAKKKKKPGKLPTQKIVTSKDSTEAAANMLRKFFNRR